MKRIFAISLMLVYLTFSVGVIVGYHFCGGKLAEITFFKHTKKCCRDADTKGSCCQNSIAVVKITSDHSSDITTLYVPQADFTALVQSIFSCSIHTTSESQGDQLFGLHKLKHLSKQPVYLINRVFIL